MDSVRPLRTVCRHGASASARTSVSLADKAPMQRNCRANTLRREVVT